MGKEMAENKATPGAVHYEIRKDGVVCCASYLPLCGYTPQTIREMMEAGFELWADGVKVKRIKA